MLNSIKEWLKPGIGIKRWIMLGILGIILLIQGLVEIVRNRMFALDYLIFFGFLILSGIFLLYIALGEGVKNFTGLIEDGMIFVNKDSREISSYMVEKKMQINGPRIVALGGGNGLSTMLKGLKYYSSNITAVVTVGDDGGGSGTLRNDMGILPPGDIRNCLVALANTHELMEDLMQYRFKDGSLKGQSFGNLFIAAMNGVSMNFEDAVSKMSNVLAITGKVLPVTLDDLRLSAKLRDGTIVEGESYIGISSSVDNPIISMKLLPENVKATDHVLKEIANAEAIIMGPGSLFTSVLPNLLIGDVAKAIKDSKAVKIYIANIMTQPGETDGYTVSDHVKTILEKTDLKKIDYVIANDGEIKDGVALDSYMKFQSKEVLLDRIEVEKLGVKLVTGDIARLKNGIVRHNPEALAAIINDIILESNLGKGKPLGLDALFKSERNKLIEEAKKSRQREEELRKNKTKN